MPDKTTDDKSTTYFFMPHTDPSDKQKQIMEKEIKRLVKEFTSRGLSFLLKKQGLTISRQGVSAWVKRGRISAYAAHKVCQLDVVKAKGFTREGLRPDVPVWYIEDEE